MHLPMTHRCCVNRVLSLPRSAVSPAFWQAALHDLEAPSCGRRTPCRASNLSTRNCRCATRRASAQNRGSLPLPPSFRAPIFSDLAILYLPHMAWLSASADAATAIRARLDYEEERAQRCGSALAEQSGCGQTHVGGPDQ